MTMSLMQSLKKRTNLRPQFLVLALGFVCLLSLLSGCSEKIDVSAHYGEFVQSEEELTIYERVEGDEEAYAIIAKAPAHSILSLAEEAKQDMQQSYFQLKDAKYYIEAEKVQPTSEQPNDPSMPSYYLPFAQELVTQDSYTLYDDGGAVAAQVLHANTYPIYIKEEDAYGVCIDEQLFYIKQQDVKDIQDKEIEAEEIAKEIPVLMYHEFYSEAQGEERRNTNLVEKEEFHEQLQYLKDAAFTTVTMKDLDLFMDEKIQLPRRSVAITIDDGAANIYTHAYPELKSFGFHATIFSVTLWAGDPLPEEFQEMQRNNIEIQSHSHAMHEGGCQEGHGGRLLCIDYDSGVEDTKKSLEIVGDGFVYCYPFGDVNEKAKQIMKDSGMRLAFTTAYGTIAPGMDRLELPRIRIHGGAGIERFIRSINY